MHPFLQWIDQGTPATMDSYQASHGWLEHDDLVNRGLTIRDFMDWLHNRTHQENSNDK